MVDIADSAKIEAGPCSVCRGKLTGWLRIASGSARFPPRRATSRARPRYLTKGEGKSRLCQAGRRTLTALKGC